MLQLCRARAAQQIELLGSGHTEARQRSSLMLALQACQKHVRGDRLYVKRAEALPAHRVRNHKVPVENSCCIVAQVLDRLVLAAHSVRGQNPRALHFFPIAGT